MSIYTMRIYEKALLMVGSVARLSRIVKRHDPDLARQMKNRRAVEVAAPAG
jgi:hypothetical protein